MWSEGYEFVLNQLSETQPRDDYRELLDYINIPWNHSTMWHPFHGTATLLDGMLPVREHSIKQGGGATPYTHSKYGSSEISSGSQLVWKIGSRMSVSTLYTSGSGILLPLQLAHQTMTWCFFNNLLGINQLVQSCQRSPVANLQAISGTWMR